MEILSYIHLIVVIFLQLFCGWAIINKLKLEFQTAQCWSLGMLLGMAGGSMVVFALALLNISFSIISLYGGLISLSIIFYFSFGINAKDFISTLSFKIKWPKSYELIFLLVLAYLLFISLWRCVVLPPFARDMIVGAELMAKYAVEQGSLISTLFLDRVELSSNNPFKPPYIVFQQIIYKLIGFEFGKIWLSLTTLSFTIFLYSYVKQHLNVFIAGVLSLLFLTIPEIYAYTFVMLYDYSNMVFFSISIILLHKFLDSSSKSVLILSSIFMAVACFVRVETMAFALGAIFFVFRSKGIQGFNKKVKWSIIFMLPSILIAVLWFKVYMPIYFPEQYNISSRLNSEIFNINAFFVTCSDIIHQLILSAKAKIYYGYFAFVFLLSLIINVVFFKDKRTYFVFWIVFLFTGYCLMTHALPLIEIDNTVKRGFFKVFPLMLFYIIHSKLWLSLSNRLSNWESS